MKLFMESQVAKIKWPETKSREQSHITIPELVKKLAVPPKKRTNGDRKLIADALYVFISSIAPFKEGFLKSDANEVAKRAELRTVDANQTVFRQGEPGSEFYFVLQGSVAIQVGTKIVKILGDKVAFGELALQCKCKRSASVVGAEDATHLLAVSKKLYHRHFAETHRKDMASKMKFIEKLNAGHLTPDQMAILCTYLKMQKVAKHQKICSANGPAQNLYYLIEGRAQEHGCNNAKMLRKLLRDPAKDQSESAILKVCKSLHVPKGKTKEIMEMLKESIYDNVGLSTNEPLHRLASLLAGQVFGESSWVYGSQAMTTVVARSDCKLWVLPFNFLEKLAKEHEPVRHHLHKMARQKLQFRLARFDTLNRARKVTTPRVSTSTPSTQQLPPKSSSSFDSNCSFDWEGESNVDSPRNSTSKPPKRAFFSRCASSAALFSQVDWTQVDWKAKKTVHTPRLSRPNPHARKKLSSRSSSSFVSLSPLDDKPAKPRAETSTKHKRKRRKIRCMTPVHKPVLHGFMSPAARSTSTRDLSSRNLFGADKMLSVDAKPGHDWVSGLKGNH